MPNALTVRYDRDRGLLLSWQAEHGVAVKDAPVRVRLKGSNVFRVWAEVDSGEGAPAWADPDLNMTFFGSEFEFPCLHHRIEEILGPGGNGYRIVSSHGRAEVSLYIALAGGELEISLGIRNNQHLGGLSLPLCVVDLSIEGLGAWSGGIYESAHAYGGRTHGWGKTDQLDAQGVPFVHGCIGLAMPLVYLQDEAANAGLQFEFMMEGRPTAWLYRNGGGQMAWRMNWTPDRLLEPNQEHAFGGRLRLKAYAGRPVEQLWLWRDQAQARYGLQAPPAPQWARRANIVEFNSYIHNTKKDFTRLDDPKCLQLLKTWKDMGYNMIFTVGHFNSCLGFLSPLDYDPCEASGGAAAEKQYLDWAAQLGFKVILWVTTVGLDRTSPLVARHPEWWTHRPNGDLFYCWDSYPKNNFVGYAPDGDPVSRGWREHLAGEITKVIGRGYSGVFIDGCIPRASNHLRWDWPGQGRDGVADQVRDLARHIRSLGKDLILFVEDDGLYAQACCEMVQGRYNPFTPFVKKAFWDHGMGGGPESQAAKPGRITPEMAREYLLLRYGSQLPGALHSEISEGYYGEATRPWTVQSLLGGNVPKTHSQYVDFVETWQPITPDMDDISETEKDPARRRHGHQEFLGLMKLCRDEPLIREAPLSIEGVRVEGDDAVVAMIRPSKDRAILAVMQFANRTAKVKLHLADPKDIPAVERPMAAAPQDRKWSCREILHSMVDEALGAKGAPVLGAGQSLSIALAPYGFRIFELTVA